jgi:MFS family permease
VFATVALSLLVFELTGSALGVGAVVFVEIAPVLLLAPFAGTLVDRLPRLRVMTAADLLRAVLAATLIFVGGSVGAVYAIAFGLSVGTVLFNPAANSALPALVEDRELVAANSGIWTAAVLSQIALAPVAGLLYAALGAAPAFAVNAGSFLTSAVVLAGLRLPAAPVPTHRRGFFADAGARLLATDRLLRALGAGQALAGLSAGATSALLVVLAGDHLDLPPSGYGLLLSAIGVGAVLGPFLLTHLVNDPDVPRSCSAPTCCAAWSTSSWRHSPPCRSRWPRSRPTGWAPPAARSPSTHCSRPIPGPTLAAASSPASTCSGTPAASPRCSSAACWPPPSASKPSTTWAAHCSCSPPPSAGTACALDRAAAPTDPKHRP